MLKNSRVGTSIDTARLAQALRSPGMDTRTWVSLAIVKSVVVDELEGVFADVELMPSRGRYTARIGQAYAGNGFGLYAPVEVDDEVLVEAPSGDPDEGLVLTQRLQSASDPPSADAVEHPEDVLLVVKPGKSLRLIVDGGGDIVIETRGGGLVKLGGPDAYFSAARVGDRVGLSAAGGLELQTLLDTRYAVANPASTLGGGAIIGAIEEGSSKVKIE